MTDSEYAKTLRALAAEMREHARAICPSPELAGFIAHARALDAEATEIEAQSETK